MDEKKDIQIPEKFLPIGTVVLLKGGKKELMITNYCIVPAENVYDKNGKVEKPADMYDYGACFYPEGMVRTNQIFGFNHDQIDKICHMGYQTEDYKKLSIVLNGGLDLYKKDQENKAKNNTDNTN